MEQKLFFNILTFDWPQEPVTMYFSDTESQKCQKLYFTLFPNEIEQIFPNIVRNSTNKLYTTFTGDNEGFLPLTINFQSENPDFIKRYYSRQVNYYFRKILNHIVKVGFVKENQIWLKSKVGGTALYSVYEKYSLKIQLCNVSKYPELVLSYDGKSKVCKQSVAELTKTINPVYFKWVLCNNKIIKLKTRVDADGLDINECFPVINKGLEHALDLPLEQPSKENRYPVFLKNIKNFYQDFLDTDDFRRFLPLRADGFVDVSPSKIDKTSPESNILRFKNGTGFAPKFDLKQLKPFKKSPYSKIHLFFITHQDLMSYTKVIKSQFDGGFGTFNGMTDYVNLAFFTEEKFSIVYANKLDPLPEIEEKLKLRKFDPEVKYIAIYLTPFEKSEKDIQKRKIYHQVKEALLKRRITSQVINPEKMIKQGIKWKYSLPNIAVAMLAKLDGIPWCLNVTEKTELVVGVGAFKHIDINAQFIGSAFSFSNNGKLNRFEYFHKDELDVLAGSIADAVIKYATVNNDPDRLIIHFYKKMSDKEIKPIQQALANLGLPIPVFVLTINKTESEDIVAFDSNWSGLMPVSGTFINIGKNKYLLFNNTRYKGCNHSEADGWPFPIKIKTFCTNVDLLNDVNTVNQLIDQVYQFSRIYWKSLKQQNLPVTIKYPEMVAQIAPHFNEPDIPPFGKDNLWFL
jgi:hypothetical protein